jgi:uncharacterized integral membrane protein
MVQAALAGGNTGYHRAMESKPMTTEAPSRWVRIAKRWRPIGYALIWLLLLVIVLQNLEPTRFAVLFWSVAEVPKLVLMLGSMVLGVLLWELGRLLLLGRHHLRKP